MKNALRAGLADIIAMAASWIDAEHAAARTAGRLAKLDDEMEELVKAAEAESKAVIESAKVTIEKKEGSTAEAVKPSSKPQAKKPS